MASIKLHNDRDRSVTYVSNTFIDQHMTLANGEYVKIYLYLLRCMNSSDCSFSLSAAADRFDHTEKDVHRALLYWEKMNLLKLEYDEQKNLSSIHFLDMDMPKTESSGTPAAKNPAISAPSVSYEKTEYTPDQMAAFQEKEQIQELLFVLQHYLKRPLTPTDLNTIFFWYDRLEFPADLIEYLIEYCLGKGHSSLRYMDKVAIAWKKEGIDSVAKAKRASTAYSQSHYAVMRAFGITGRNLIPSETKMVDKWVNTYGFTLDIITEACTRTISSIHQPRFDYADGILSNWHKQGVHHLTDIVKLDSQFAKEKIQETPAKKAVSTNKFNNFNQRSYDFDKLEQQLLNNQ